MADILDHDPQTNAASITATAIFKLSYLLYSSLLVTVLFPAYRIILKDYHAFLALGPGGTPSTFAGYLRVSYLRLFAISDPFQPPSLAQALFPDRGYLFNLPRRTGCRPVVAGIAPQRQLNQRCSLSLHHVIRQGYHKLAAEFPSLIKTGNSCFEKHGIALFLSPCSKSAGDGGSSLSISKHLNPTCSGEICHLHASDSSMHLTLHPLDAALVIAQGWGERHPLAGRSIHGKRLLPPGFVMIYTPCLENEVPTVMEIVKAAAWWVGGVDLGRKKLDKAVTTCLRLS